MVQLDQSRENALPKLRAYLSAIFNVSGKKIEFLPCYRGYLVLISQKNSVCLWIHQNTIESVLRVGFNLIWEKADEILFKLVYGGWILKEVASKFIVEPPKDTVSFVPGLNRVEQEVINFKDDSATGTVVKGVNIASDFINKTSHTVGGFLWKTDEKDSTTEQKKKALEIKSFLSLKFPDYLYTVLSQEKTFKDKLFRGGRGFELRTVYIEAGIGFVTKLSKQGFTIVDKGHKNY